MKYLKSFGGLIKESNRFLHFKEVLDTIEDLSLDFKDDGGETIFGNMPSVGQPTKIIPNQNVSGGRKKRNTRRRKSRNRN